MPLTVDSNTGLLPPGEHPASLAELEAVFCFNYRRRQIFSGLTFVVEKLHEKRVERIWIDGSFVTMKERPKDVDVIYEPRSGSQTDTWGLLSFARHNDLKELHRVDLWPYPSPQPIPGNPGQYQTILDFFKQSRDGQCKGVVILND